MSDFTKLDMQTPDLTQENIKNIATLFPNVVTETIGEDGKPRQAIDFDLLKQQLSDDIVEGGEERYRLDRPGKRKSLLKANTPITKTLRPVTEDSVNWESTENLYIEGDNFEVLKILQESYLGQVKMIYIDPPYNTGKDFVYKDNFKVSKDEYEEELDLTDDEGGRLVKNTDTNGRFHSDWLSMMYERLIVARDLLKDNGVIFMSIDDNEVTNLRKVADEVFGQGSFIGMFSVENNPKGRKNSKFISVTNEYCLIYARNLDSAKFNRTVPKDASDMEQDENGDYIRRSGRRVLVGENFLNDLVINFNSDKHYTAYIHKEKKSLIIKKENELDGYDGSLISAGYTRYITYRNTSFVYNTYSEETFKKLFTEGRLIIKEDKIYEKHFSEMIQIKSMLTNKKFDAIINNKKVVYELDVKTTSAKKRLNDLIGPNIFDFPKNESYIKALLQLNTSGSDIILDFFSGSGSTAHAVMELNAEDGGNRRHIQVQLPEEIEEGSEAHKAGYKYITEIGKERIRRAGQKILEDYADKITKRQTPLDIGFRVYRTDSTNMKDVYYHPSQVDQNTVGMFESNIKEDRTPEDLLTQVMLDLALPLSLSIETKTLSGNKVFFVDHNALVACFDEKIDFSIVDQIAESQPLKVVFRDSCFKDDKDKINVDNRFKRLSPETIVSVI